MTPIRNRIIHSLIIYHFIQALANRIAYQQCLQFVVSIHLLQEWDKNSRLKSLVDDKNHVTSYTYDALNRRKKEILPDLRYKEFTYDTADNIHIIDDPNGSEITQTFDDINRLTNRSISRGTGVIGVTSETYGYDGISRMTSAGNDYSTVTMDYDTMSRLLTEQQQIGGQSVKSVVSAYDNVGNRTRLTYPSSSYIDFVPDELDRIHQIKDASQNVIAQYTYAGPFRVTGRSYYNGTNLAVMYDANRRPITYTHGATISGFEHAYDKEDNKLYEKRTHDSGKGDVYTYDSIYRLITAKIGIVDPVAEIQNPGSQQYDSKIDYNMDGVGNRNTLVTTLWNQQPVTTSYSTNNLNQYTQVSSTNYAYDYNGNLTDDNTYLYAYDYANRLMEVKRKSDSVTIINYQYDALGRRIKKYNSLLIATKNYYLDRGRVIEERDGNDTVLATYTHGNWIDEILTMERNSQTYYYHENSLGSIYAVTNGSGNIVEKYEYDPYGKVTIKNGDGEVISTSAIGNVYTYTGREYDQEIGLYYYRARYYSPELGRFLQRDPIGYFDSINPYEYVRSNCINKKDPLGLKGGGGTSIPSRGRATPIKPGTLEGFSEADINEMALEYGFHEFLERKEIEIPFPGPSNLKYAETMRLNGIIPVYDISSKIMSEKAFKELSALGLLNWKITKRLDTLGQIKALLESIQNMEDEIEYLKKCKKVDWSKYIDQLKDWINVQTDQLTTMLTDLKVIKPDTPNANKGPAITSTPVQKAKEYVAQQEEIARKAEEIKKAAEESGK